MNIISKKRCIIGEGPIWNASEKLLYFVNAYENQICSLNIQNQKLTVRNNIPAAAISFDTYNRMIISTPKGVFYLNSDNTLSSIYDNTRYNIRYANDMKVGPDGRLYVGTQSGKRIGISNECDGKLYSIDKYGSVKILIDGMSLSNGMEWSINEKVFYHTDSDTHIIKEYHFDKKTGDILYTGRYVTVQGIDGFTIDSNDNIYAACWDKGHVAVIDTKEMKIKKYLRVPTKIPVSCTFGGKYMDILITVTASFSRDTNKDKNAGFTFASSVGAYGRKPYLFGQENL